MKSVAKNIFGPLLLLGILLITSCSDSEIGTSDGMLPCLVEINGSFVEEELDKEPLYKDGEKDGFLENFYGELKYPFEAREMGVEGRVEVSFVISEQGMVTEYTIEEDPGTGLGDAAVSALEIITQGIAYFPAELKGRKVRVKKTVPVVFKLEG